MECAYDSQVNTSHSSVSDLNCLDPAALESWLGVVPGEAQSAPCVVRVIESEVWHQLGLHVELDLVAEHVGHHAAHHQHRQHQDGDGQVDHQEALDLFVAAVEAKKAVGEAEEAGNNL